MNGIPTWLKLPGFVIAMVLGSSGYMRAQKLLSREISMTVNRQPVSEVLKTIGRQGNFYFSYNSRAIPGDSLVTLKVEARSVRQVLDALLAGRFQYKETGDYIIIQRAAAEPTSYITGMIRDGETGKEADYVSVYSKALLTSALTGEDGLFRLKVKENAFPLELTISKIGYADTTITLLPGSYGALNIWIKPRPIDLDEVVVKNSGGERHWLAKLFVSSRLRAQSRNIGKFFVSLPYQASFTPGLSTQGKMSSQVTNKLSLNLLGGYTAGVEGLELAAGFNISKKDVKFVQIAGVFNMVAGRMTGLQVAGFHNHVLDSLRGVQASGFGNIVAGQVSGIQASGAFNSASSIIGVQLAGGVNLVLDAAGGVQVSGLFNRVSGTMEGAQVAGAINVVKQEMSGLQIAGLGNVGRGGVSGLQLGPFNYAKNLKGIQVGLVNIADSSAGYSIGIINLIKYGKSNISVYANDLVPLNIAWKMGNRSLYSIVLAGAAVQPNQRAYTFGLGLGKAFRLGKRLSVMTELTSQTVYLGDWEEAPGIGRLQAAVDLKIGKTISLNAGPALTVMYNKEAETGIGYKIFPPRNYGQPDAGSSVSTWFGWQAGVSWQYGKMH